MGTLLSCQEQTLRTLQYHLAYCQCFSRAKTVACSLSQFFFIDCCTTFGEQQAQTVESRWVLVTLTPYMAQPLLVPLKMKLVVYQAIALYRVQTFPVFVCINCGFCWQELSRNIRIHNTNQIPSLQYKYMLQYIWRN